jgi:hypothetical protein
MSDLNYDDLANSIVDFADDSIIADAVSPIARKISCQPFAVGFRVFGAGYVLLEPTDNDSLLVLVDFFQLLLGGLCEDQSIRQGYAPQ